MTPDVLSIDTLSSLLEHLSGLTGLSLSVHDEKGNLILPPAKEDRFLSSIRSSLKGRDEYDNFVKTHIDRAMQRRNVSLIKGPTSQYHLFIPVHVDNSFFIITGSGVYSSIGDFEDFYKREGQSYGLLPQQLRPWAKEIIVRDYVDIQDTARHIQSVLNLVLKSGYEGSLGEKRYRLIKTVFGLITEAKPDIQEDGLYDMLVDIILFLFNADSVSIMARDDHMLTPRRASGRLKERLESMPLKITGIISEAIGGQKALYSDATIELLRLGLGDEFSSLYVFPVVAGDEAAGVILVFNTAMCCEEADILLELCKITGFILRLIGLKGIYHKGIREIDTLNSAAARLNPVREPDMLYEAILDVSVHLAGAEKGSLMLVEEDASCLAVKAARGINKRFLTEIKVRAGEGIAGKVFREGVPLKIDDIEKNDKFFFMKRAKYKTRAFISLPLKIGEETIGVLNICDKATGEIFSEEDMDLLSSFATYASIAVERSMYYALAGHLRELSITDVLTGLFNRRYFEERFYEELQRSERHNLSFSLLMLDIDDFKLFNDTEGHLSGDDVLKRIADIAKDNLRVIDVISRFGGEEFAVIMPQTEGDEAFLVAERIRKSIKERLTDSWDSFPRDTITVSIGIATFPSDGAGRKELIQNTDRALYKAKMEGKDMTVVYENLEKRTG
jgi:diguanylate cyclase (GGDEF)-like protein